MIAIATWNVNSVRARLSNVLDWLRTEKPHIVLLQETKVLAELFPREPFEDLGYNLAVVGQKSYNGVAILSKFPIEDIVTQLPGQETDPQARYVEAVTAGMRVISLYVPNGDTLGSDKYAYKISFLNNLEKHMETLLNYGESVIVGGDYNIAPQDADTSNPEKWSRTVLGDSLVRASFRHLLGLGYTDAVRALNPVETTEPAHLYSWWDYRSGAWERQEGLRIDHLLLSPHAMDRLDSCATHQATRGCEKASDHAPVVCYLRDDSHA